MPDIKIYEKLIEKCVLKDTINMRGGLYLQLNGIVSEYEQKTIIEALECYEKNLVKDQGLTNLPVMKEKFQSEINNVVKLRSRFEGYKDER